MLASAMLASLSGCGSQTAMLAGNDHAQQITANSETQQNTPEGATMLKAAWDGRLMEILLLLDKGVDPDIKGVHGITALSLASQNNHNKIVKTLLEHGADPNLEDEKAGWFPLMWASYNGFDDAVQLLLKYGADVNKQNIYGETALIQAAFEGRDTTVRILLEHGADYTLKNDKGFSALEAASNKGYFRIIEMLTQAGAKLDLDAS